MQYHNTATCSGNTWPSFPVAHLQLMPWLLLKQQVVVQLILAIAAAEYEDSMKTLSKCSRHSMQAKGRPVVVQLTLAIAAITAGSVNTVQAHHADGQMMQQEQHADGEAV